MSSFPLKEIISSLTECFSSGLTFKQLARTFSSTTCTKEQRILAWLIFLLDLSVIVQVEIVLSWSNIFLPIIYLFIHAFASDSMVHVAGVIV